MNNTLRTFIHKAYARLTHPSSLAYGALMKTVFPEYPYSKFRINARLSQTINDIKKYGISHNIGALAPRADLYAAKVYGNFLRHNTNNLGNWSNASHEGGTKRLEYELIQKLIHLYKAKSERVEGYVTSGGTEGNLYAMWLGKAYLLQYATLNQLYVLQTDLTHYSIDKACAMFSLAHTSIPLNPRTWTVDIRSLKSTMLRLMRRGTRGFLISATVGYTETGSSDDIKAITTLIDDLRKTHKYIHVSIIVDAAFNGLILPFITDDYRPFTSPYIHSFSIDFSKLTAVPYGAGVVLYRKHLRDLIEKEVPVFSMRDNTISGSRPGATAAAIWAVIHQYGKSQFRFIIRRQLRLKEFFIERMRQLFPNAEIISDPLGLTCGIILHNKKHIALPKFIEKRYWLYAKKKQYRFSGSNTRFAILYKFFFLPHVSQRSIDDFIGDLQKILLSGKL